MAEPLSPFIPSAESLRILARAVGSRDKAIDLLTDALRGGKVDARGRNSADHHGRIRPVPIVLWRDATERDRDSWSWSGGAFSSSSSFLLTLDGGRYEDVSFDTVGILDLCEEHGDPANISPNGSSDIRTEKTDDRPAPHRGGNPGKVEAWHRFWMEAMTMLDEGALEDRQRFPTQKSLMDEMRRRIEDGLSEESVKPHVSRIWRKFAIREE